MTSLRSLKFRSLMIGLCGFMALNFTASADDATPTGLIQTLSGKDASSWIGLQPYGVNLGGWAASGINYNTDTPIDRSNGPVSMTDRAGEFHLYQLNLFIEKAVVKDTSWDVGGRFDFMFGTDTAIPRQPAIGTIV